MRSLFRAALTVGLAATVTIAGAQAEPAAQNSPAAATEIAMDGPDRYERVQEQAPERVQPPQRRPERVTPPPPRPAPAVQTMKYEKMECKTLTNTPYDCNWTGQNTWQRPTDVYYFDNENVHMFTSTDLYRPNRMGAMGADQEFMRLALNARLGVWANGNLGNQAPRSILNSMVARMQKLTCGTWSSPQAVNVAGVPAYRVTGVDEFGNYHYELYALQRFGNTYAFARRTDYSNRWNTQLQDELAYMISHIHPHNWDE